MSVKRTYSSRVRPSLSSLPSSDSASPSPPRPTQTLKRKAPVFLEELGPKKRVKTSLPKKASAPLKKLSQLHFIPDVGSTMRSCSKCEMSYTRGAPEDESLHRAHCARVLRGMEWGREEERIGYSEMEEVESNIKLKNGKGNGRIIAIRADVGGKMGSKLKTLLDTINRALSAPDLPPDVLRASKAYLFLMPALGSTGSAARERITGCVIASHITNAMSIVQHTPPILTPHSNSDNPAPVIPLSLTPTRTIYLSPTHLPTPLGIPRIFVPAVYRRLGIANALLDAAAANFIHGCPLDPKKGEVAFSQPTAAGEAVMSSWGGGGVRVYED